MAVALDVFLKQLTDSGVLDAGRLENFVPPKAHPKDADELIRELVNQNQLTAFQAQEIAAGRGKSLILGNYTILDKIGAGGMGQVFKAEHRRMHRLVAIKMLPPDMTRDLESIARFQREVTAAAKLRHHNIVAADDADEANGVHFLVMEFIEGNDLAAIVKKNGTVSVEQALDYALQAAKGLEFAHKKGVVHRDIKPGNLLLHTEGTVKILDMGLARIDSPNGVAAVQDQLTGSGAVMGTIDYMSPEQALNTKNADARADIYSLGCTLNYLLTGQQLYAGETIVEKLLAHREQPIPSLRAARKDVPERVDAVFKKMVAKTVEDRYQTMTQVIADLERCIANHATSLENPSLLNKSPKSRLVAYDSEAPTIDLKATLTKKAASAGTGITKYIMGVALLGSMIFAVVIFSIKTKGGTLIVEVDQPDAVVQVLNEEGKVEINDRSGKKQVTLSVVPGKHKIKVEKDGFVVFGDNFEIESGGKVTIAAKLEPVKNGAVAATTVANNRPAIFSDPTFPQWMKETAALPAQDQKIAVAKKLQELNPGFDGIISATIDGGVVTKLSLVTENITDISPVRALEGLEYLSCGAVHARDWGKWTDNLPRGKLSDLSPLQGLKLDNLFCNFTKVSDLTPLRGMPLTQLYCTGTKVVDLSPIQGMKLTNLHCGNLAKLDDISPVQGMPLVDINFYYTKVSNLSPLKGMPLRTLACSGTPIADLSSLQGMPLTSVRCQGTSVSDLSPLKNCKSLKNLEVQGTKVTPEGVATLQKALPDCKIHWDDPATPKTPTDDSKASMALGDKVDLMPLVDLTKHTLRGDWSIVAGSLVSPIQNNNSLIQIPYNLPEEYHFDLVVERISKIGHGINIFFASSSHQGTVVLEGAGLTRCGLEVIDGKSIHQFEPAYQEPILVIGKPSVVRVSILKKRIVVVCDGKTIIDWQGNLGRFSIHQMWPVPKANNLFIGTQTNVKIHSMTLTPILDSSPKTTRPIATLDDPSFQKWMKDVAAMPAEQQVGAVTNKLQELNPGYDGKFTDYYGKSTKPKIEYGVVTEYLFTTDFVTDISPVRALIGLKTLSCGGIYALRNSKLSDLSPLKGMQLTKLVCGDSKVSDLTPLKGMPLESLLIGLTLVTDLSPLEGMKLVELNCADTPISNLSALQGMPLKRLTCNTIGVSDLSPLQGMSLTFLDCSKTKVFNLSPLHGMPMTTLLCFGTPISDLSPLQGMPLRELRCERTSVNDLSFLHDCKTLTSLRINFSKVTPVTVAALQKALPNCKIEWDDPAKPKTLTSDPPGPK